MPNFLGAADPSEFNLKKPDGGGFQLMRPKYSPVRYTILTLEQPVPENKKVQRNAFKRGVRCGAGQIPSEG